MLDWLTRLLSSVDPRDNFPGLKEELDDFRQHLLNEAREMPELKAWQLQGWSCNFFSLFPDLPGVKKMRAF